MRVAARDFGDPWTHSTVAGEMVVSELGLRLAFPDRDDVEWLGARYWRDLQPPLETHAPHHRTVDIINAVYSREECTLWIISGVQVAWTCKGEVDASLRDILEYCGAISVCIAVHKTRLPVVDSLNRHAERRLLGRNPGTLRHIESKQYAVVRRINCQIADALP